MTLQVAHSYSMYSIVLLLFFIIIIIIISFLTNFVHACDQKTHLTILVDLKSICEECSELRAYLSYGQSLVPRPPDKGGLSVYILYVL